MKNCKCEVTWNNLQLETKEGKKIIGKSSGQIRPYTLTALLGPSGSGKTTLLNSLAGRIEYDQLLTGDIKANGRDREEERWAKTVAYVGQSFQSYEWQTVDETLEFVANLKIFNKKLIRSRVDELITVLGLGDARNTCIRKLSGGEKMRVSLGLELLGDPLVILVDEPLSGLDSFNAINILEILKKITQMGKTVLVTIHQPSYMMMSYFDKIMLMCQGGSVYEGTLEECIKFFEECGFELPKNTTPTDFFLATLSIDNTNEQQREESLKRIDMIRKEWEFIRQEPEFTITEPIILPAVRRNSSNVVALMRRLFSNFLRNSDYLKSRIFQKFFIGILFGLTFYNTGLETADIFTFRGIMSFTFQTELFGVTNPILNAFIDESKIISRECKSGLYTGYEAYISKHFVELILNFAFALPYHMTVNYMIGFSNSYKVMARFYLIILVIINYSVSFGLTIGTLAKSVQAAQVIGVTFNVSFMLYSGTMSNPSVLPSIAKWLIWCSPMHYAFRSLVHNQLSALPVTDKKKIPLISNPGTIQDFGLEGMGMYPSLGMLILFAFILQLIGAYSLHIKSYNNLKIKKKLPFQI